jgi:hypothetical protein
VSDSGNLSPTIGITSPNDGAAFREGDEIMISTIANDLDGTVSLVEFYDGATKIGEQSSAPFNFNWNNASIGNHEITAVASDNNDAKTTSKVVTVSVSEVMLCAETSTESQQGNFSTGYKVSFETVGTSVTVSFELLDTEKNGVVAYLWKQSPFGESQMENESGLTFSKTISGFTIGETISYACKFAYAGGLSATKYFSYVVGNNCTGSNSDETAPENLTASIGGVTSSSIELLLNSTDNSGKVVYDITYGNSTESVNGDSGTQKSHIITGLTAETGYTFSIQVKDLTGNVATGNPISLQATTSENTNSECSGIENKASQGSFSTGYNYEFTTNGTDVTFTFELLDADKTGVVAFLWKEAPFGETQMNNAGGKKFTKTLSGFTNGQTISYACKFAFAGGLAATKYFSYTVGNNCALSIRDNVLASTVKLYPNPVKNILNLNSPVKTISKVEIYSVIGKKVIEFNQGLEKINIEELSSGIYLIKIISNDASFTTKFIKE